MTASKTKTILLVDDEREFLQILKFSLEILGFQALLAENGNDAFEILRKQRVDAVVTDIRMPNGGGLELFRRVRDSLFESPPFVLSTGFSDISRDDAEAEGVAAVLFKPYELSDFEKAVNKAIALKN